MLGEHPPNRECFIYVKKTFLAIQQKMLGGLFWEPETLSQNVLETKNG